MNRTKYYDIWALMGVILILALLFAANAKSAKWENLDRFGETRMVTLDHYVDPVDFDDMVKFIPINGYGYGATDDKTVMVFEAKSQVDWPTIEAWVELLETE